MKEINFYNFDILLKSIPKDINKLIHEYYSTFCSNCQTNQRLCLECKKYQCFCIPDITQCNVKECSKTLCCIQGIPIVKSNYHNPHPCRVLCPRCYRIDIYHDILEDIRINGPGDDTIPF